MRFGCILLLAALLGVACQSEPQTAEARALARKHNLPSSNGTHNELTLFCDRDLWEEELGVLLLEHLVSVPLVGATKSINKEPNNIPPTLNRVKTRTPMCCTAVAEKAI